MKSLLKREAIWSHAICILRIWVGIIFIWYGRNFYDTTKMQRFADFLDGYNIPLPLFSAYLSKTVEFFGGWCLVCGLFTRIACILMVINMTVATFITQRSDLFGDAIHTFLLLLISVVIFFSALDRLTLDAQIRLKPNNQ
ncbi:MAG: DoxX family protein [Bacteroidetes bacterium]|nr:DoxX family protein [Bacteroidota bacterium]